MVSNETPLFFQFECTVIVGEFPTFIHWETYKILVYIIVLDIVVHEIKDVFYNFMSGSLIERKDVGLFTLGRSDPSSFHCFGQTCLGYDVR